MDFFRDELGISETIANFDSDSDSTDSNESIFFFRHFFNEAEMAYLTQNMKDALQQAAEATALERVCKI